MSTRPRRTARAATVAVAATGVAGLVLTGPAGAAAAASATSVVDRETVQARLGADGELESARLYEQLTVVRRRPRRGRRPDLGRGRSTARRATSSTSTAGSSGAPSPSTPATCP